MLVAVLEEERHAKYLLVIWELALYRELCEA
jgi:hypothetical protein